MAFDVGLICRLGERNGEIFLRHFRAMIFVAIFGSLLCGSFARGDLLDDFKVEYPAAVRQLEADYSHVKIYGTKITRDNRPGKGDILSIQDERFFRDGNRVLHEADWIKSDDSKTPAGTVMASSGNGNGSFTLLKQAGNKEFVVDRYGSLPNFWADMRLHLYPLFAVDYMIDKRVIDYCNQPTVKLISAKRTELYGVNAIEVTTQQTTDGDVKPSEFYFQPKTWALLGWMHTARGEKFPIEKRAYFSCKIRYVPGSNPPKLASMKYWIDTVPNSKKPPIYEYQINKVEFGSIPGNQFTLAAFGAELPGPSDGITGLTWTIISAVVLVILAILYEWLRHRRKRRNA